MGYSPWGRKESDTTEQLSMDASTSADVSWAERGKPDIQTHQSPVAGGRGNTRRLSPPPRGSCPSLDLEELGGEGC